MSRAAGGRRLRPVWQNELGGLTFAVGDGDSLQYVKWTPHGSGADLAEEARRLTWAGHYAVVPTVIGQGADGDGEWLLTSGIPGANAVAPQWRARPAVAVAALGHGLRLLHETLPAGDCPFSWSAGDRVAVVRERAAGGLLDPATWSADLPARSVADALEALDAPPPVDRLVVCQGDACAPNTLLDEDGGVAGHCDLGSLGVADRWADLAVATWSTVWNYGPGWEQPLLEAYGIDPDPVRTAWYRLLWELGP